MNELKPLKLNKGKKPNILKILAKHKLVIFFIGVVLLAVMWWEGSSSTSVFNFAFGKGSFLDTEDGRVNVLLLGIAGGKHDGPNLTDTIMVASYDTKSKKADLISLPRDLWADKHKAKVNTLYQIGLNKGKGFDLVREEVADVLGIEIPYVVRVDFNGFIKAVDLVEGLDVEVIRTFDDFSYPLPGKENELCDYKEDEKEISEEQGKELGLKPGKLRVLLDKDEKIATAAAEPGKNIEYTDQQVFKLFTCRFEHLSFTKGLTHMDGETALKFVRSRHGTNSEGTDFARSKRQQLVLQSFRGKVLSMDTLGDLSKVTGLIQTLGESIDSNIPVGAYPEFIKLVRQSDKTESFVIDSTGKEPLLIAPPVGQYGAWVLIPPNNDFTKIHQYVSDIFSGKFSASESAKQRK